MKKFNILKSNFTVYFLSITGAVFGFVLNIILSRSLEIEQLDKVKYLVSLCTLLSNVFVIGLPTFIIREISKSNPDQDLISKCYSLYFFFSIFIAPIIYFVLKNYLVYTSSNSRLTIIIISISFFMGVLSLFNSYLLGKKRFNLVHVFETIIPKFILLALSIFMVVFGAKASIGDYYFLVYLIIYFALGVVAIICLFKKMIIKFSTTEIISLIFLYGITIAQILSSSISSILQSNLFPNVVGVTSTIATSALLMSVIGVFTNVINSITKPAFSYYNSLNDKKGIIGLFEFATRTNLYLSVPIYLFFIICPSRFLIIFGEHLTAYPIVFSIIAISHMFASCCGTTGAMLSMIGKEKLMLLNTILQFIVFVICVFIFKYDSIRGIAFCTLVSEAFVTIIKYVEVVIIFKKSPLSLKTIISLLIMIACDGAIIYCFNMIPIQSPLLWLAIAFAAGCVVLLLNILLTPNGKKDIKHLLKFKG